MKLLAIDIGSAQIKSVLIDVRFNRFDILQHDMIEVEDALMTGPQAAYGLTKGQGVALQALWQQYSGIATKVAINVPHGLYASRILTFPFSDKKKIAMNARFQVEDEVPFDLDKSILATQIFSTPGENGETIALCGIAPLDALQGFLKTLHEHSGIDPDVLTASSAAMSGVFERQPQLFGGKSIAVVNLGHRRCSINVYRNCIPAISRSTMVGGYDITMGIASTYNISPAEAEVAKQKSGFLAPPGIEQSSEQKLFSDLIANVLEPVFHDFYQCLMAHYSRTGRNVSQIFVSGGSARLPGVCDYLSARWQIPVHPLSLTSQLPNMSISPPANTELIIADAIKTGLSQVEGRAKSTLNFRIGALRPTRSRFKFEIKELGKPIRLAAIVYCIALLSLGLQSILLNSQVKGRERARDAAIKKVFNNPKAGRMYRLKSNPANMRRRARNKLNELKAKLGGSVDEKKLSALRILNEMSSAVPRGTTVEIKKIEFIQDIVRLKLESPTKKEVNAAIDRIKTLDFIKQTTTPIEIKQSGTNVAMQLELKLKNKLGAQ